LKGLKTAVVRGSAFELTRVFQNLFKNALEAGATRITVTTAQQGNHVEVSVSDNGVGMDEETARRALKGGFTTKPMARAWAWEFVGIFSASTERFSRWKAGRGMARFSA